MESLRSLTCGPFGGTNYGQSEDDPTRFPRPAVATSPASGCSMHTSMRLLRLICSAFLVGSPLLGQLQFLNTDTYWFSSTPVIVTDSTGNTYVVSKNSDPAGGVSATKLDSSRRVLYSFSFTGVTGWVSAAAVDSQGSLIIGGDTSSTGFPRVNPLFYPRLPTSTLNERGFVAKLDPAGTRLMFSTLVGGNELDPHYGTSVIALTIDSADRIYFSGTTTSPTLPVSRNAYQQTGAGPSGFVMRISNAGDALQFSTYLGGAPGCQGWCGTNAQAIVVDGHGVTVAGTSGVIGFPVTRGSFACQCATSTNTNVFVSRFNADGSTLQWSALLFDTGFLYPSSYLLDTGSNPPSILSLAVDSQGNATVAINTLNKALPVTSGAVQPAYGVTVPPSSPAELTTGYLATLSSDGANLLHSTYYGGTAVSTVRGLAQDPDGNFWITGDANSTDLPMPAGSLNLGVSYLAELDPSLTRVLRYYGAPRFAIGQTVNILPNRDLVLTGGANSLVTIPATGPTQPSVWGAVGSAEPGATPHIAGGELISLYGVQLGPDPGVAGSVDASGKLRTAIAGYTVLVNGISAPLLYAGPNQINLVVPFEVAGGTEAAIQVITPDTLLTPITGFAVGPTEPQVFPVMLNQDGSINSQDHPAPRNSIVTIWATGGGAMDNGMVDGQISQPPLGNLLLPVLVELSHLQPATTGVVTYAGAAPGMVAGVIQINFRVPPPMGLHGDCGGPCPVLLTIGGRQSLTPFPYYRFYTPDPILWLGN